MKLVELLAGLLIVICISTANVTFNTSPAIDLYQYWGVGMAKKLSGGMLSSPYVTVEKYDAFLDTYSAQSNDTRLRISNQQNHGMYKYSLEVNASPMLYAVFALMPSNFSLSYGIYLGVRAILFLSALYLLCPGLKLNMMTVVLGILCVFLYKPLGSDARVGNLNTLQLFAMAACTCFIGFQLKNLSTRKELLTDAVVLSGIVFVTLLKPNFLLIALALSASLAARRGILMFSKAAAFAAISCLIFFLAPCIYFKSLAVWSDWLGYLSLGTDKLSTYGIWKGNFSTSVLVSNSFNLSINNSILVLVILFIASSIVAVKKPVRIIQTIAMTLGDPYLTVTIAVVLTLALSPLVWFHYYILSILPAFWMITMPSCTVSCRFLGILSLFLSSGLMEKVIGINAGIPYFFASSWVPLWVGSLILVSQMEINDNGGKTIRLSDGLG